MKKIHLLAVAAMMIPLAGVASDDKEKPKSSSETSGSFDALDTNKDGRISMPEASADPKLIESFSKADKNGDGYLDASEYESSSNKPRM